jgi:hypothetical protein
MSWYEIAVRVFGYVLGIWALYNAFYICKDLIQTGWNNDED